MKRRRSGSTKSDVWRELHRRGLRQQSLFFQPACFCHGDEGVFPGLGFIGIVGCSGETVHLWIEHKSFEPVWFCISRYQVMCMLSAVAKFGPLPRDENMYSGVSRTRVLSVGVGLRHASDGRSGHFCSRRLVLPGSLAVEFGVMQAAGLLRHVVGFRDPPQPLRRLAPIKVAVLSLCDVRAVPEPLTMQTLEFRYDALVANASRSSAVTQFLGRLSSLPESERRRHDLLDSDEYWRLVDAGCSRVAASMTEEICPDDAAASDFFRFSPEVLCDGKKPI